MDLFIFQEDARQRTGGLVSLLVLVIGGVVLVLHFLGVLFSGGSWASMEDHWRVAPLTVPLALGFVAIGVIARTYALREGGRAIASELGGYRVHPSSDEPRERRLLAIVENLSTASGVPVPEVWVLPEEEGINSFVAGNDPSQAVVGVTRGALERLSREELQAVLAHEFSHMLSGEMSLNFGLLPWVQGILFLTAVGGSMLRSGWDLSLEPSGRSSKRTTTRRNESAGAKDGGSEDAKREKNEAGSSADSPEARGARSGGDTLPILGLILMMLGSVSSVFGRIFQGAICREREVVADAAAVAMTDNPAALVRALKKMGGMENGSLLLSPNASQVGHLFFGQAAVGIFSWIFPTHPPVEDRIRQLEPDWSGDFLRSVPEFFMEEGEFPEEVGAAGVQAEGEGRVDFGVGGGVGFGVGGRVPQPVSFRVTVADQIGAAFGPNQLVQAGLAVNSLRPQWRKLTLSKAGARKLAVELCKKPNLAEEGLGFATPSQALLLLDMAMPLLRRMSPEDYWSFRKQCRREVHRGEEVDVFRFLLAHVMGHRLGIALGLREPAPVCFEELPSVWEDLRIVFSLISKVGSPTPSSRLIGYANAWSRLPVNLEALPPLWEDVTLWQIVSALRNLEQASPTLKGALLGALVLGGSYAEQIGERELALVRLLGDAIGAPTPPVLRQSVT